MEKVEETIEGFQRVRVVGVFMSPVPEGVTPVVFLENDRDEVLPIYIGAAEAFSIQTALEKVPYPRPLTHDLLVNILEGLNSKIERVLIDDLSDGVFFARLIVRVNGNEFEFDARPSDSIALAVRTGAPVYVSDRVMESASVSKDEYRISFEEGEGEE
ncbi:bifunctional nuclease family protein [Candidatus Pyrohabitans sp.]